MLGLLLVVALGSGAVAQSPSPSPEAAPLFAPDDVASTLPSAIGGMGLQVFEMDMDYVGPPVGDEAQQSWRSLLQSLDKGPEDVRSAAGMVVPAAGLRPDDLPLTIYAVRIDGVAADVWAESYADAALAALDAESRSDYLSGWRIIGGRDIYGVVLTPEAIADLREVGASVPDDTGLWARPVGEVLYWILMPFEWPDGAPTVEDVLAELPFPSPSPEPVPLFAPDDLTSALPSSIGPFDMTFGEVHVDELVDTDETTPPVPESLPEG